MSNDFLVQVDDVGWADFNYNIEVNQLFTVNMLQSKHFKPQSIRNKRTI